MPFSVPPQQSLTREAFASLQREARAVDDSSLDEALTALDGYDPLTGTTDADQLRDKIKLRYAIGIRHNADGTWSQYTHGDVSEQVDAGMMECVCVRTLRRIAEVTATLFSQADQSWTITTPGEEEPEPETDENGDPIPVENPSEDALATLRERGKFDVTMVRADRLAVALGSCLVRVLWRGGRLAYEAIAPQCVHLGYGRQIEDGGDQRSTDTGDIEDASVVVIKLPRISDGSATDSRDHFVAYFGRSQGYPRGRCVEYLATDWYRVPEPNTTKDILYEHQDGAGIGNPLTMLQDRVGVESCPWEYPVAALYGTDAPQYQALPRNGRALFDACVEMDLAWSRMLACAHQAASKTFILTSTEASMQAPPSCISGAVRLGPNEQGRWDGPSAADVEQAANVVARIGRTVAEAWNVPGYLVLDDEVTSPQSGVALAIRTQPMITHREMRERINRASVMRLFDVERCVVQAATGTEPWPAASVLSWYPGRLLMPRNELELIQQLQAGITAGIIDTTDAIKEYHQFATDAEAEQYARDIARRSRKVPGTQRGGARMQTSGIVPGAARQQQQPPEKQQPAEEVPK
jgi:hypothetical protein